MDETRMDTIYDVAPSADDPYRENKEIADALQTLARFANAKGREVIIVSLQAGYKFGRESGEGGVGEHAVKIYSADCDFTHLAPHEPRRPKKEKK